MAVYSKTITVAVGQLEAPMRLDAYVVQAREGISLDLLKSDTRSPSTANR